MTWRDFQHAEDVMICGIRTARENSEWSIETIEALLKMAPWFPSTAQEEILEEARESVKKLREDQL